MPQMNPYLFEDAGDPISPKQIIKLSHQSRRPYQVGDVILEQSKEGIMSTRQSGDTQVVRKSKDGVLSFDDLINTMSYDNVRKITENISHKSNELN